MSKISCIIKKTNDQIIQEKYQDLHRNSDEISDYDEQESIFSLKEEIQFYYQTRRKVTCPMD